MILNAIKYKAYIQTGLEEDALMSERAGQVLPLRAMGLPRWCSTVCGLGREGNVFLVVGGVDWLGP